MVCLRKLQLKIIFFSQNTTSKKRESANYSFSSILLHILQFSQNTEKLLCSYAKYSLKFCAKYKSVNKMLRKIQYILLRKIQVSLENASQNTVTNCCVQSSQSTDSSQNTISLFRPLEKVSHLAPILISQTPGFVSSSILQLI